ncbi:hypothetical protein [Clostridium sp.]|uniref:hypothetical protein n=1 Tax=Clostridium sp. TaxID=1506 RepID=UPI00399131BC
MELRLGIIFCTTMVVLTFSLSLGLAGTIINPVSVLAENVAIEINEEKYIDGYININDYLKLTSGSYEKRVIFLEI